MITKILSEKPLTDDNIRQRHLKTELKDMHQEQHVKRVRKVRNIKSEDFVFRSYKYEKNQFISSENNHMLRHDSQEYTMQENKQNELEMYKMQLQKKSDHFNITDFEQEEQGKYDENLCDKFDIKPMQLIDFDQEDNQHNEQIIHDMNVKQASTNNYESNESINNDQQSFSENHHKSNTNNTEQKKSTNQIVKNDTKDQLKEIQITKLSPSMNIHVQILDKELLVTSKIPPGIVLKCKLKRSSGFMSIMNPQYDLYLENGMKHLLSAKKNVFNNRQLFYLSTEMQNYNQPIRTLMSNISHNTFWLVDKPRLIDRKMISYLDILIDYKPLVSNKREMTILCPPSLKTYHIGLEYDIPCIDFYCFQKNITLQLHYRQRNTQKKSSKVSEKNFDLIDSQDQELSTNQSKYRYLKMQKSSQNIFDIEIQHPLTPLQAMGIVLTRFDAQLK